MQTNENKNITAQNLWDSVTTCVKKEIHRIRFSSVQFSHSVMYNYFWPHEMQHARPTCPLPTPSFHRHHLSWWCHPAISFSVVPSFPALNLSQHQGLFKCVSSLHQVAKNCKIIAVSSSTSVFPGMISFSMDCLNLFAAQGTLKSLLQHHSSKASITLYSAFSITKSHIHTWPLEKQ